MTLINVTRRTLKLKASNGAVADLPPSGYYITVAWSDRTRTANGIQCVERKPMPTKDGQNVINAIHRRYPDCVIIGESIVAEAYPGQIVAPLPFNNSAVRPGQEVYSAERFREYTR